MAKFIEMLVRTSEHLFARGKNPIRDFRESWTVACQREGVPNLLFHDLRRTAVRNLEILEAPRKALSRNKRRPASHST